MNESYLEWTYSDAVEHESNSSSANQTIDGLVLFSINADTGDHIGEPIYSAFVKHDDLKNIVYVSTPDVNETVKIASTLKFN